MTTNVYWVSYHDDVLAHGYWDNGLLDDIFKHGDYKHHEIVNSDFPPVEENQGGIFIINGRTHVEDIDKINADIAKLRWVLFIDTGDEEASFPWREIRHPIMRVWVMMPRMNEHNDVAYKLPNGYRAGTRDALDIAQRSDRPVDVSFVGQVNHDRREQCVEAAESVKDDYNIFLRTTDGFGKEVLNQSEYMQVMANSKIVLCPSGVESPDNFRLYEALEAGCLPIADAFSSKHKAPGFWKYLFGSDMPFPILDYWDALPKVLPQLIKEYPGNANRAFAWWQAKKREIRFRLEDDVKELSR